MSSIQYPHTLSTEELLRISRSIGLDNLPSNWVRELHARLEALVDITPFHPKDPLPTRTIGQQQLPLADKT